MLFIYSYVSADKRRADKLRAVYKKGAAPAPAASEARAVNAHQCLILAVKRA
jgi:hypothetical protein